MINVNIFGKKFKSEADCALFPNNSGGFFLYSDKNYTSYQGLFFFEAGEMYKSIHNISAGNTGKFTYTQNGIELESEEGKEKYSFFRDNSGLIFENESDNDILISLDCRKAYDSSKFGKFYEISYEDEVIIIHYKKRYDAKEPNEKSEYDLFTAIIPDKPNYQPLGVWKEVKFEFDEKRNDNSKIYIYEAIKIKGRKISVSSSLSRSEAIKNAKELSLLKKEAKPINDYNGFFKSNNEKIELAYSFSMQALTSMMNEEGSFTGLYAGLPWFFQYWTRDSALSAKAFYLNGEKEITKNLLFSLLHNLRHDGIIPSRFPESTLHSIDSSGLVFFRLMEIVNEEVQNKNSSFSFTLDELAKIEKKLLESIENLKRYHSENDLLVARPYETWMDTDARDGARIEIECLFLAMYSFLSLLSRKFNDGKLEQWSNRQEELLLSNVRKIFFRESILADGIDDYTIRPNIFLAYYFYPKLLNQIEWEQVFDKSLKYLWLPWGGLSTIDVRDNRFQSRHSGMNNKSYHLGDSWFFLNNLAAIVLHRVNKRRYSAYIDKILEASTHEILNKGILGYHAELSSAEELESNGCLAQSWSSAMFIELVREIYG